jgi:hypothetical protein
LSKHRRVGSVPREGAGGERLFLPLELCFHLPQFRLGKFLNISGGVLEGDDLAATGSGIGSKNR